MEGVARFLPVVAHSGAATHQHDFGILCGFGGGAVGNRRRAIAPATGSVKPETTSRNAFCDHGREVFSFGSPGSWCSAMIPAHGVCIVRVGQK